MNNENVILSDCEKIKDFLIKVRRDFHQNPELGMEEYRTRKKIISYLKEMKIEYKDIADTGVIGMIKGKEEGKTVALRADMDGLPIQDQKKVPYKSTIDGKMHACGHDAHMSILLGAGKILRNKQENLKGNIKLLFQPAEETIGGAKRMIEEGAMENPKVDAIFGLHVAPEIPVGKIGIKYDKMNAASQSIQIKVYGKGTHGAYPHTGVDAIFMAGQIITGVQSIISRNVDPRDCAVITLGTIKGGTQGNIIANHVEMVGTVRTINKATRNKIISRIKEVVNYTCSAMGGKGEVMVEEGYPCLRNDNKMVNIVKENGINILGKSNIINIKDVSLGVEDFAYFLKNTQGAFFRLGCRNEKKGIIHSAHTDLFDIEEDCLVLGTAIQVKNALEVLKI